MIVREAYSYLQNFTVTTQNIRLLRQCRSGTSSEWIAGHAQGFVDFLQSFLPV